MRYVIVGLGNPGEEYKKTRHNVGREALHFLQKKLEFSDWEEDKKKKIEISKGKIGKHEVSLVFPTTFMNKSGSVIPLFIKSKADRERLLVIYDELDLPLGRMKLSYGRSSGGHNGLESIIRALKSKDFLRARVGVSPHTPGGKLKKPSGEKEVIDFILGKFKPSEEEELKKIHKKLLEVVELFVGEGREQATMVGNSL